VALVIFARWQPLACLWSRSCGRSGRVKAGLHRGNYLCIIFQRDPYIMTLAVMMRPVRTTQSLGAPHN